MREYFSCGDLANKAKLTRQHIWNLWMDGKLPATLLTVGSKQLRFKKTPLIYNTSNARMISSFIGFCAVSVFGWLFCFTLLSCFAEKTAEIDDLKWSTIGAVSLGVLWVFYDATLH